MKKKIIKSLSLLLAGLLAFSTPVNAADFAITTDTAGNSEELVEYQTSDEDDFVPSTNVFAEIGSEYKVTIPKVIVLSGTTKKANYYVKVEGDIAGLEEINVLPDENITLSSVNKASQIGTITQDKTNWKYSELGANANGFVEAPNLDAGKWSGSFNFNITLDNDEGNKNSTESVEYKMLDYPEGITVDL